MQNILLLLLCSIVALVHATDNNLTQLVTWDKYSLSINNSRVFLFAGEFHYQRLPVPELWPDIFQKIRAHGLNAVSIYFFWSYHSPSPGIYDFETGGKNVQRLLDAAKDAGLWVIARPGPYCNAETNSGGLALWTTDGSGGKYRTSDETYRRAWSEWVSKIGQILKRNQITEGGPVVLVQIENELSETIYQANNTLVVYMEQLKSAFKGAGIVVPLIHNEKGMRSVSWSTDYKNVGGAVDIYGLDSYPGGLSCVNRSQGFKLVRNYHEWFKNYSFTQPEFMPEFEAGWFQPHGGAFYDDCAEELNPSFPDVYYKNNIGQRVTLLSLYMVYGGTNWGHSAAPVVYSSYDYTAPLRETRQIRDKFRQTKLLGLFLQVSKDLLKTDLLGYGPSFANTTQEIWTWHLRNPDTGAGFYVLQQTSSPSRSIRKFSMSLQTSESLVQIPEVELDGRQSKIVVTNYKINDNCILLYSTAEIVTFGVFDRPVLVLYLKEGQRGELAFKGNALSNYKIHSSNQRVEKKSGSNTSFTWKQQKGFAVLDYEKSDDKSATAFPLVYLMDIPSAWSFFAPTSTRNAYVGPEQQIFVMGPYLIRNATVLGDTISIIGDRDLENDQSFVEAYVGNPSVRRIKWNGRELQALTTAYGALKGHFSSPQNRSVTLPSLDNAEWKTANSLPEIEPKYGDSKWTVCNHNTTRSPSKPLSIPVLFSSDYGFYTGIKIYRGYFSSPNAKTVNITVSGGDAFGWNAWLNGRLLGGHTGEHDINQQGGSRTSGKPATWVTFNIGNLTTENGKNYFTVLCDYHGHDQTSLGPFGPQNPRGLLGVKLHGQDGRELKIDEWRIMGNAGAGVGKLNNIDMVRGPMNEGGLYGERMGWHLPGFDTSTWKKGSPLEGYTIAGVAWYSTTFDLSIEDGLDVPLGIEMSAIKDVPSRIQIFVNGYQYGKYLPHIGPQTRFPIPSGIINTQGTNTLALSVWAQSDRGARLSSIKLIKYGSYETGFDFNGNTSYLRPRWTKERLGYG